MAFFKKSEILAKLIGFPVVPVFYNPNAELINGILVQQLRSVFKALIAAGADTRLTSEKRPSAESDLKNFRLEQYHLW